jgi:hypothetical protein
MEKKNLVSKRNLFRAVKARISLNNMMNKLTIGNSKNYTPINLPGSFV